VYENVFGLLQSNNMIANTTSDCEYLRNSVIAWLLTVVNVHNSFDLRQERNPHLAVAWAQLLPVRCDWQRPDGVITFCGASSFDDRFPACKVWRETIPLDPEDATTQYFGRALGIRVGELTEYVDSRIAPAVFNNSLATTQEDGDYEFYVRAIFNESTTVVLVYVICRFLKL
jgi:hypothetical protein